MEEELQTRVKLLETEKNKASLRVLELEKMLLLRKKEHQKQMEKQRADCEEAICKVSLAVSSFFDC